MRQKFHDLAEKGRILEGDWATFRGERYGLFMMTCPATGGFLKIFVSAGEESEGDDKRFPNGTRWRPLDVVIPMPPIECV